MARKPPRLPKIRVTHRCCRYRTESGKVVQLNEYLIDGHGARIANPRTSKTIPVNPLLDYQCDFSHGCAIRFAAYRSRQVVAPKACELSYDEIIELAARHRQMFEPQEIAWMRHKLHVALEQLRKHLVCLETAHSGVPPTRERLQLYIV